jgi:hypothetical protein
MKSQENQENIPEKRDLISMQNKVLLTPLWDSQNHSRVYSGNDFVQDSPKIIPVWDIFIFQSYFALKPPKGSLYGIANEFQDISSELDDILLNTLGIPKEPCLFSFRDIPVPTKNSGIEGRKIFIEREISLNELLLYGQDFLNDGLGKIYEREKSKTITSLKSITSLTSLRDKKREFDSYRLINNKAYCEWLELPVSS